MEWETIRDRQFACHSSSLDLSVRACPSESRLSIFSVSRHHLSGLDL
jgi:hypothetical protein